jgi:uncharacterized lipoprotein YmbA
MRSIRRNDFRRAAAAMVLAVGLAACSSVPTHFYTLMQPADPAAEPGATAPFAIDVMPVGIPAQADQPQLVVRTGAGSVAVLDNEHWAAPLADEVRAALSDDLVRALGTRDVRGQAGQAGEPVYRIQVDVRRFESVPADHALIDADWSVRRGDAVVAACRGEAKESVAAGYEALVEGHQRALAQIAAQIATTIRRAGSTVPVACSR